MSTKNRESKGNENLKKTVFILYIPGGGVLNVIPALVMAKLSELTESPLHQCFQMVEAVSGGSILAGGLNVTELSAMEAAKLFYQKAPEFLPIMPGRNLRLGIVSGINALEQMGRLDPLLTDRLKIEHINALCNEIRQDCGNRSCDLVNEMATKATARWLNKSHKKRLYALFTQLEDHHPDLSAKLNALREVIAERSETNNVRSMFKKVAYCGLERIKRRFNHDLFFDPSIAMGTYEGLMGNMRMSDCLISTYISAYDLCSHEITTFFARKADLFGGPASPVAEVSNSNNMIRDAIMASTAHPLGFEPHETEDGRLCMDMANVHSPIHSVDDALRYKPDDADVKLVVLHTGSVHTVRSKREIRAEFNRQGVMGSILNMQMLAERYTMSMSGFYKKLNGNVVEIFPQLHARNYDEEKRNFPSPNPLDSSPQNMRRVWRTGLRTVKEYDQTLRQLAQEMIDNQLALGLKTAEDHQRITIQLGIRKPEPIRAREAAHIAAAEQRSMSSLAAIAGYMWRAWTMPPQKAAGAESPACRTGNVDCADCRLAAD